MGMRPKILNVLNCTATLFTDMGRSSANTWHKKNTQEIDIARWQAAKLTVAQRLGD
jgi:hypothetical protein